MSSAHATDYTGPREQYVRICACGCGAPTLIAKRTRYDLGHQRMQPVPYRRGHGNVPQRTPRAPMPRAQFVVLCRCGCGLPTLLARRTNTAKGQRRGQPLLVIAKHNALVQRTLQEHTDPWWENPLCLDADLRCPRCGTRLNVGVTERQRDCPLCPGEAA